MALMTLWSFLNLNPHEKNGHCRVVSKWGRKWGGEEHVRGRSVCWARDVSFTAATCWSINTTHERRKTYSDVIEQWALSSYTHLSSSLKRALPASSTSLTTSFFCAIWHSEQFTGHLKPPGNFYWQTFGDKNIGLTHSDSESLEKYVYKPAVVYRN